MKERNRPWVGLVALAILMGGVACGDGDSTGPGQASFDLNGGWSYNTILLTEGFECGGSAQLQISHSGSSVSGTYSGLQIMCTSPEFIVREYGSGSILNGSLSGSTVSFDLGSSTWSQAGGVQPDHTGAAYVMQGQVNVTADLGEPWGMQTFVNNSWQAIR